VFIICVPTPLNALREPDLSYVRESARAILPSLRRGSLVVLESTTYPGTTDEVLKATLEESGLVAGQDFFLAFSPEREDPGNANSNFQGVPKVVGGDGSDAQLLSTEFYSSFVGRVVQVSNSKTAEAVKLTENIFRSVNIALVNELKTIYAAMGIDVWEVIDAAKTKPFGFMPFYPGPGLGGHCIPIDPFYLTWKAKEFGLQTRFIELSGEINRAMPKIVAEKTADALNERLGIAVSRSRILIVGIAYKKNVDDLRESPALAIIDLLESKGASISYHDPYIPMLNAQVDHPQLAARHGLSEKEASETAWDVALIITDHDALDLKSLTSSAAIVIDTRNAMVRAGLTSDALIRV
jgi:UDP-N-acetyl-D-glucosamine dehydrogenase